MIADVNFMPGIILWRQAFQTDGKGHIVTSDSGISLFPKDEGLLLHLKLIKEGFQCLRHLGMEHLKVLRTTENLSNLASVTSHDLPTLL